MNRLKLKIIKVCNRHFYLILSVALMTRILYILLLADPEYDGYDRFLKGICMLSQPFEVRHHWCWLPLFQYIDAMLYWLTHSYISVRIFSTICGVLSLIILYYLALEISNSKKTAFVSMILMTFNPIIFIYDTTGMTESFFIFLFLLSVFLIEIRKPILSSIPISMACLVRYEAWFLVSFLYLSAFFHKYLNFKKFVTALIFPSVCIASWLYINFSYYGNPLHFILTLNRYFEFLQINLKISASYISKIEIWFRYL
ncbi:TPA: phospholipid carrier-dependent glycosyltransferase, partial [Candidatus Bathyarchaeota archaeon]|nr:phospholipid carrier-dependent glycosyltransferase [Candidatus Bathyarchaeota archaeon]